MGQLRADLRSRGIESLPAVWQFVQVDVNPVPESTAGLGDIRNLGGHYVAMSSASNTFNAVRHNVESKLAVAGHLEGIRGTRLSPRDQANNVLVTTGAGQYRAVGRMLTLTRLDQIEAELNAAWERLQQSSPWGGLKEAFPEESPYDNAAPV